MPIPCPPDEIRMSAIYNEIYRKPLISDDNSKLRILSNEAFISSGDSIYKIPDLFSDFCGYTQSPKMYLMHYDADDNFIISHDGGKTWFPPIKNPVADDATSMRGLNNSKYWTNIYTVTHRTSYNNKFIQESTDLGLTWKNTAPPLNGTDSISVDISSDNNSVVVVKSNNIHYLRESSFWNSTPIGSTNVTGVATPKNTLVSYTSHNASPGIRRRFQSQWFTPTGTIGASASICCSDDGVSVFAGSMSNGIIYKSTTSGNNFSSINLGVTGKELHIYCDETGKYVLVRQHLGTNVWLSTDKGATFNNIVSKLPVPITTSHSGQFGSRIMSYSGEYMAIPADKKLNLSKDYGNTWYVLGDAGAPLRAANNTDYAITSTYQKILQTNPFTNDTYITSINYTGLAESDNSVDYVFQVRINGVSVSYDKNITINGLVPISIIWDYSQQLVIGDTVEIWVKLSTSIPGIFNILGSKTTNNIDIETYILYEASSPIVYFSIEEENLGSTQEPVADFYANDTTPTTFDTVSFYDISQFQPNVWEWTINPMSGVLYKDGTNSSSQNPKINFSTVGTYDITLKAYNAFGDDTEIKLGYIVVSEYVPTPTVDFSADDTTPTVGQTVNITDLSTNNPTSWLWDITWDGAGGFNYVGGTSNISQNIQVEFTIDGVYTVTLTATNAGGSGVLTKNDYINVLPSGLAPIAEYDAVPKIAHINDTIGVTDLSTNNPTSWVWDLDDANYINGTTNLSQNPQIIFTAGGVKDTVLTATNIHGSDVETKPKYLDIKDLIRGLISYYPFISASLNDVHGNNHGNEIGTLTQSSGIINQAVNFNGTDSKIEIPCKTGTTCGVFEYDIFSISVWVKWSGSYHSSGAGIFMSKYKYSTIGEEYVEGWALGQTTFGAGTEFLIFQVADPNTSHTHEVQYEYTFPTTWTHIVATKTESVLRLYINGTMVDSSACLSTVPYGLAKPNIGGVDEYVGTNMWGLFKGDLDEIGFWNRALSDSEILFLYNSGNGIGYPFTI